jgi:putative transcriptional regulator
MTNVKFKNCTRRTKIQPSQSSEKVGVSRQTISNIETGEFVPTARLALLLCLALDKKFKDLFYFKKNFDGNQLKS